MSDEKRIGTTESVGELLRNKSPLPPAVPGLVAQQCSPEVSKALGWTTNADTYRIVGSEWVVKQAAFGIVGEGDTYHEVAAAIEGKIVVNADAIRRAFKVPGDTPIEVL